ncbi:MAG: flagellar motor switch protein FliN [bacterium]
MAEDDVIGVLDETDNSTAKTDNPEASQASPIPTVDKERTATPEPNSLTQDLQDTVADPKNLEMLLDVNLKVTVEFGRARMKFRDVLDLSPGSIVELSKQTSEPVDILVNDALLATGEVVVLDDHFAIRIIKLLNRVERLKRIL